MENNTVVMTIAITIFCLVLAVALSAYTHFIKANVALVGSTLESVLDEANAAAPMQGDDIGDIMGLIDNGGTPFSVYEQAKDELDSATRAFEEMTVKELR